LIEDVVENKVVGRKKGFTASAWYMDFPSSVVSRPQRSGIFEGTYSQDLTVIRAMAQAATEEKTQRVRHEL
jgi:hypothetical protein